MHAVALPYGTVLYNSAFFFINIIYLYNIVGFVIFRANTVLQYNSYPGMFMFRLSPAGLLILFFIFWGKNKAHGNLHLTVTAVRFCATPAAPS